MYNKTLHNYIFITNFYDLQHSKLQDLCNKQVYENLLYIYRW